MFHVKHEQTLLPQQAAAVVVKDGWMPGTVTRFHVKHEHVGGRGADGRAGCFT
jgi:hypothetical protein